MKEILKIVQLFVLLMAFIAVDLKMSNAQTYPDNMLIADCVTGVQPQPWNAHVLNSADNIHCYYVPIVGDMDGDGEVEIVVANATSNDDEYHDDPIHFHFINELKCKDMLFMSRLRSKK